MTQTGLDGVLAREGLGLALEAKATAEKDPTARQQALEDSLAAFVAMQPDDKGPGRAYALYHQGRILVQLGKRDEAKAAFQKAKDIGKDKDADLAELVDERLAMLGA
jgi:tetratricopeptide (TPR) repeat protein